MTVIISGSIKKEIHPPPTVLEEMALKRFFKTATIISGYNTKKGTDEINYITRNVRHGWAHDSIGKSVIDICTDYNQQLLILCDQEVWQYIKPSRSYKRLFTAPENYSLFSLIKDKQGGYYIGTRQYEVLRCDSNWNITSRIQSALKTKRSGKQRIGFSFVYRLENRLWYGIKNQSIERYTLKQRVSPNIAYRIHHLSILTYAT